MNILVMTVFLITGILMSIGLIIYSGLKFKRKREEVVSGKDFIKGHEDRSRLSKYGHFMWRIDAGDNDPYAIINIYYNPNETSVLYYSRIINKPLMAMLITKSGCYPIAYHQGVKEFFDYMMKNDETFNELISSVSG